MRGDAGRVRMTMELVLRFDYGAIVPWVSRLPDGTWRAIAGPDMVVLRTPVKLHGRDLTTIAEFEVAERLRLPGKDRPLRSGLAWFFILIALVLLIVALPRLAIWLIVAAVALLALGLLISRGLKRRRKWSCGN